jgi:hypothetical protein
MGLNGTFSQIGNLSLPDKEWWTFCISGKNDEHWIQSESGTIRSILFSTDGRGNRSIRAFSANLSGFLIPGDGCARFAIESNLSFFPFAQFISSCESTLSPTHPLASATVAETIAETAPISATENKAVDSNVADPSTTAAETIAETAPISAIEIESYDSNGAVPSPTAVSAPFGRSSVNGVIVEVMVGSFGLAIVVHRVIIALVCWRRRESHCIELVNDTTALHLDTLDWHNLAVGKWETPADEHFR